MKLIGLLLCLFSFSLLLVFLLSKEDFISIRSIVKAFISSFSIRIKLIYRYMLIAIIMGCGLAFLAFPGFQISSIVIDLLTTMISVFIGILAILYFTHQFSKNENARKTLHESIAMISLGSVLGIVDMLVITIGDVIPASLFSSPLVVITLQLTGSIFIHSALIFLLELLLMTVKRLFKLFPYVDDANK